MQQPVGSEALVGRLDDAVEIATSAVLLNYVNRLVRKCVFSQRHRQRPHDVGVFQIQDLLFRSVAILPVASAVVRHCRFDELAGHDFNGQVHIEPFAQKNLSEATGPEQLRDHDVALLNGLERDSIAANDANEAAFFFSTRRF